MGAATKFTFDVEFCRNRETASEQALPRDKKTMTFDEIERLRAEAIREGARSAEARASEAVAAQAEEAAAAIRDAVAQSLRKLESIRGESAGIAMAAAQKLARAALSAFPAAEVEAVLRDALHQAIGEPRVVLRAAPCVAEVISRKLHEIAHEEGFEGRIQISADPAISAADCRIEWRGGGAERAEAAIETAIAELIARRFANSSTSEERDDAGQ